MSRDIDKVLVGQAGDVLVPSNYYHLFSSMRSEPVEWDTEGLDGITVNSEYRRLVGIPPIRCIGLLREPTICLTEDGRIILLSREYPEGFYPDVDLPPLIKIMDTFPYSVLDVNNILHFIDIAEIVETQSDNTIDMTAFLWSMRIDYNGRDGARIPSYNPQLPISMAVKDVSWGREVDGTGLKSEMIVLLEDSYIIGLPREIIKSKGRSFPLKGKVDRLIGRSLIYQDGTINLISLTRGISRSNIETDYPIVDVIAVPRTKIAYTLDIDGIIRQYYEGRGRIIDANFKPIRFFIHIQGDILVEDDGGNLYELPDMEPWNYPIILMPPSNNPIQGRRLKPVRKVPL